MQGSRRRVQWVVMAVAVVFLMACFCGSCGDPEAAPEREISGDPEAAPEREISRHIEAEFEGDARSYARTLVAPDRELFERDPDRFLSGQGLNQRLVQQMAKAINVEMESVEVSDDKMEAVARVTMPDVGQTLGIFLEALSKREEVQEDVSDQERDRVIRAVLREELPLEKIPTEESTREFTLLKESGLWRIVLNLGDEMKLLETVDFVGDLIDRGELEELEEARELMEEIFASAGGGLDELQGPSRKTVGDAYLKLLQREASSLGSDDATLDEARAIYEEILAIDVDWEYPPISEDVLEGRVERLEERIAERDMRRAYVDKIEILEMEPFVRGSRLARIDGNLKNNGDRAVDVVMLTYVLLDESGEKVGGRDYPAVHAMGDEAKVLRPGEETEYQVYVNDSPEPWAGRIEVEVGGVRLID